MRKTAFCTLLLFVGCFGLVGGAAGQQAKKSSAKSASSRAAKKPPVKKSAAAAASTRKPVAQKRTASSSKKTTSTKARRSPRRPARRSSRAGQREPSTDRYREIQKALVEKGYLVSEPDGKWDADSIGALKKFQEDQNLNASGKLDSLSLIALGLGPQRHSSLPAQPEP